jgi:lipopolysaccharide transport system ATP-binding protein
MSDIAIKIKDLGKQYRLGQVGTGTLSHDLNRMWYRMRGKEDPYLKVGFENESSSKKNGDLVWVLKDINFDVKKGEVLGIIGKNGAGKSTLLKILSQITSPTVGEIRIKGRIAALLEVGTGFHPDLTGRENVYLNGTILGMTRAEIKSKFDEIVNFSGIEKYIDTPVKRYSSGMMVRLGFAVAAHLEPEILIVDEVLAVGDAEFQKKCLGKMKDVSGEGRTILFVSHNMAAMQNLCKTCVWLNRGELKEVGETKHIISNYLNVVSQNAHKDLKDRLDRKGNGLIKIVEVIFKNNQGEQINSFYSGQDAYIVFK